MAFCALDERSIFCHERSKLGGLSDNIESVIDCLGDIFLAYSRLDAVFLVVVRVTFHVKLAKSFQVINLSLKRRNTLDLLLLLRICLNITLLNLLVKLSILIHFLTEIPESLSFGVEKEIIEFCEVQLNCAFLLKTGLWLLGGCLCTHFG